MTMSRFKISSSRDRLGYYQVGDLKTYSKMEAIEMHRHTGIHPHWNFNEETFSAYDWTQEPPESLWELYTKRAWQLREDYEYLVLNWSGGADSYLMCRVFLENGIPFEEMVSGHYHDLDTSLHGALNRETFHHAVPQAEQWLKQYDFNFRIVPWGSYAAAAFKDKDMIDNWIYYCDNNYGMMRLARSFARELDPHYMVLFDRGVKVCFVAGVDKPRIYRENNRYCVRFLDLVDNWISPRTKIKGHENAIDEFFYWSPDAVPLIIKQGHTLMRFFQQNRMAEEDYFSTTDFWKIHDFRNIQPEDIWRNDGDYGNSGTSMTNAELVHHIIYPGHRTVGIIQKPTTVLWSPSDAVFNQHSDTRRRLQMAFDKLSTIDPYWLSSDGAMKLMISPCYFLE